jgi:hypothetical protein
MKNGRTLKGVSHILKRVDTKVTDTGGMLIGSDRSEMRPRGWAQAKKMPAWVLNVFGVSGGVLETHDNVTQNPVSLIQPVLTQPKRARLWVTDLSKTFHMEILDWKGNCLSLAFHTTTASAQWKIRGNLNIYELENGEIMTDKFCFWGFFGTGVWTQGFALARQVFYHLSRSASPFCSVLFCFALVVLEIESCFLSCNPPILHLAL